MSRLVAVRRDEPGALLGRRQHLLLVTDSLAMVMDLNSRGLICDNVQVKGRELSEFIRKYRTLTLGEIVSAFQVTCDDLLSILNQTVPCVGCRRSVERLFYQLMESGHPTLDPIAVTPDGVVIIKECVLSSPHELCTLLHAHSTRLQLLVENQPRSKKSQRCVLHSLESSRSRFMGDHTWRDVWECMSKECRDEVTFINFQTLQDTLDNYLRKHRFCGECRTKVVRAYQLLVEEKEPQKVKGYTGALYAGIKRCLPEKHLHLEAKTEYIESLIERAKPEFLGSDRERHAKTLEIAQEEVLTCLGICIYERLHRISLRLKEEEGTCQVFAAVAIDALCRKFEIAVERKCGITKLEMLYDEITKEEAAKQLRKEQKKLRKRKKKECRSEEKTCDDCIDEPCSDSCPCEGCFVEDKTLFPNGSINNNECAAFELDVGSCHSCQSVQTISPNKSGSSKRLVNSGWPPREHSQDCGYSSENNNGCCDTVSGSSSLPSSPEGSDVACSEGFCNHERGDCTIDTTVKRNSDNLLHCRKIDKCADSGFTFSLQEMLQDNTLEEECNEISYIPIEDVMEFKSRHNITEKRQELRQALRNKFAQFCDNAPQNIT